MKPFLIFIVTTAFLFCGCRESNGDSPLVASFERATRVYYEDDVGAAETALVGFISAVENNAAKAAEVEGAQYKKMLDMSWLRLASIFRSQGKEAAYDHAMGRAITYFDQDPYTASDEAYIRDKRGYLMRVLDEVESERMPEWKRVTEGVKP